MFLATKLLLQSRRHLNPRVNMSMKVQNPYKISLILLQIFRFVDPSDTELHHQKKLLFVKHVTVTELRPETVRKLLPCRAKVMKTRMRIPLFYNSLRVNYCKQKWNTLLKLPPTKSGIWKKKRETIPPKPENFKKPNRLTDLLQKMKWCSLVTYF